MPLKLLVWCILSGKKDWSVCRQVEWQGREAGRYVVILVGRNVSREE